MTSRCRRLSAWAVLASSLLAPARGNGQLVVHGNLSLPPGQEAFNPASSDILAKLRDIPGIQDVQTGPLGVSVMDTKSVDGSESLMLNFLFHSVTFADLHRQEFQALEEVISDVVTKELGPDLVAGPLSITHLVEGTRRRLEAGSIGEVPNPSFEMELRLVVAQGADKRAVTSRLCELTGLPSEISKRLSNSAQYAAHIVGDVAVSFERPWCSDSDEGGTCLIGFSNGDYRRCEPLGPGVPMWMWWGLMLWLTLATLILLRCLDVDISACCVRGRSKHAGYADLSQPSGAIYDMIVVPGGGTTASGKPPPWVAERLLAARQLFLDSKAAGKSVTPQGHPWIVLQSAKTIGEADLSGYSSSQEAQANASFLQRLGIPASALHKDETSYNTLGNAHAARVKYDSNQLSRVIVVTNRFHMPRTRAVFEKMFDLPPLPPRHRLGRGLAFHEVADVGLDQDALQARSRHEEQALRSFHRMDGTFGSLDAVGFYLKAGDAATQPWLTPNKEGAMRSMLPAD